VSWHLPETIWLFAEMVADPRLSMVEGGKCWRMNARGGDSVDFVHINVGFVNGPVRRGLAPFRAH